MVMMEEVLRALGREPASLPEPPMAAQRTQEVVNQLMRPRAAGELTSPGNSPSTVQGLRSKKKQEVYFNGYPSEPQVPTIRPERELRATATSPARERWVHSVLQGTVSERHSRVTRRSEKGRGEVRKRSRNANLSCLQAGLVFVTLLQYWSKVADPGSQYICSLLFHGVQRGG